MADEHTGEQDGVGKTLKRRGILAAAGAALGVVMAGIAAKQTVQPVAADTTDTSFTALGGPGAAFSTSGSTYEIGVNVSGSLIGVSAGSTSGAGIEGTSTSGTGVYGQSSGSSVSKGVYGHHNSNGYGVYGETGAGGYGVTGVSPNAIGVNGTSTSGTGVFGISSGGNGVYGLAQAAGTTSIVAGVFGDSTTTYGIIGRTTAAGYSGLTAITGTAGVAALAATSTVPTAFAAYFTGTTVVSGNFVATGGTKSAAVKDASGQHRLVYCMESPESWFEDFGKAQLVAGAAEVKMDAVFTQIARTDDYHVFLTEYEGHNDLYVTKQTTAGFAVRAKSGTPNGSFSWRIVAKRADIKGERLAKFDLPKINHPDPDKLPKPALPKAGPSPLPPTKP